MQGKVRWDEVAERVSGRDKACGSSSARGKLGLADEIVVVVQQQGQSASC